MARDLSPEDRARVQQAVDQAGPEFIAKYGNPLDENDPRHWSPTERAERGLSLADQVKLLGLDVEVLQISLGKVVQWVAYKQQQEAEELVEEMKTNPKAALEKVMKMLGEVPPNLTGALGDSDDGPLYAGSVKGQPGDAIVSTPQGMIRVDQIPGYKDDPDWQPSTDWVDMNCLCESHVAIREHNAIDLRFNELTGE